MVLIHQSGSAEASADMPEGTASLHRRKRKTKWSHKWASLHVKTHINKSSPHCTSIHCVHCSQDGEGIAVTCASSPLVPSNVGIVVCVNLAVLRGADVQAAVLLDGDLMREALVRHTLNQAEGSPLW